MHELEPYYHWRDLYIAEEDERSPFFGREYNEFEFTNTVYNYVIHPQWDEFGSDTLYVKILYADYFIGYAILEFLGEWNDLLYNDIMFLKRNVIEPLMCQGINKFILLGEYVMNYHTSDDEYYREWLEDVEDGWIACMNFRKHVMDEFIKGRIHHCLTFHPEFERIDWRALNPKQFIEKVDLYRVKRLK